MNELKQQLPAYASDIKLNISSVIENTDESDLSPTQITSITLASSYATKNQTVIHTIENYTNNLLDDNSKIAAKVAATIMAMNNVYYRAVHLMSDSSYMNMPAKLRMNIIGKPGVEKVDFELMSLAVSAINGCGKCLDSHAGMLEKTDLDKSAIQHTLRIAAVVNSIAQVVEIEHGQINNVNA